MYKYFSVDLDNVVISIQESTEEIKVDSLIPYTDLEPTMGYLYDGLTFIVPETPSPSAPTIITQITKRSFMLRLTQQERIALRKTTDDIAIDIYEDLKIASNIDLALPEVKEGLEYFVSILILEASRVSEILVPGLPNEEYKGI